MYWSDKYPLITETALRIVDVVCPGGEAVLLGVDEISDFDGLHSRKHNDEVQFYAFDMKVNDGDDIRKLPLEEDQPRPVTGSASTASSSPTSNAARSAPNSSGTPALWDSRAWCPSWTIDPTGPAGRLTG